ncbi:tetratricopeptide repeat protein [Fimbriiglobus ruber]|uniref:TPR repeat n=1 Tax=Fimbriiglobus ruber TaxID=1908690 RepID=A0A225E3J3_9BACT|nr:tetratricopeptide repeat protein [Fimbriiglobus ruber]OWK43255.1 TPR repeat [Fimbriiglobus ruber]
MAVGVVVLAAVWGFGREGWAYWQERSAKTALEDENLDEASRHIGLALRVRSGRVSTNFLAARIDRARREYAEAEQHLVRCKELGGMTEPLQMEWLLLRCEKGDVDELAPGLLAAVEQNHPESPAILEAMALVYMRQARYHEAKQALNKWVELAPKSSRARDWRGWVYNQLDERGPGIEDYSRALELRPTLSAVRLRLAQLLIDSSRHLEALPHLERLHAEQPDDPDVMVGLAACRAIELKTPDARQLLDRVLAAHPNHFGALVLYGDLERQEERYAEAERWLRKALEQKPRDPTARYSLHLVLLAQPARQKDAEEERVRWEQDRDSVIRLGRLLRTELVDHPNDPDLAAEAGELLIQVGEEQRGLVWLNKALAIDPRHLPSHKSLLAYYEKIHDATRAAAHRQFLSGAGK